MDAYQVTKRKAAIVATQPKLRDGFRTASVVVQGTPPHPAHPHPAPHSVGASLLFSTHPSPASTSCPTTSAPAAPPPPQQQQPSEQHPAGPSPSTPSDAPPDASSSSSGGGTTTIRADLGEIVSPNYCLLPVNLQDQEALAEAISRAGLKLDVPTYVLSECVLVYMDPEVSDPSPCQGFRQEERFYRDQRERERERGSGRKRERVCVLL
jgi:hypothetical protein